jgi:hypothetical protein
MAFCGAFGSKAPTGAIEDSPAEPALSLSKGTAGSARERFTESRQGRLNFSFTRTMLLEEHLRCLYGLFLECFSWVKDELVFSRPYRD